MSRRLGMFILVALFLCAESILMALDWPVNFCAFGLGMDEKSLYLYTSVWKHGETLTLFRSIDNKEYYQDRSLHDLQLSPDGFYELEAFGSKLVVMFGSRYFFFHDVTHPEYSMFNVAINYDRFYKQHEALYNYEAGQLGRRLKSIVDIKVPDVLEEKGRSGIVRYDTIDMKRYYARTADGGVLANPYGKPWATSKNPVDMTIDIEFNEVEGLEEGDIIKGGSDYLIILNGYANPLKRHLYKENRRIKTLRIDSLDDRASFSTTYELEDVVRFHVIKFPQKAKKVRLTILDYYEGSKYKDLCVQAFLTDYDMWIPSGQEFRDRAKPWKP